MAARTIFDDVVQIGLNNWRRITTEALSSQYVCEPETYEVTCWECDHDGNVTYRALTIEHDNKQDAVAAHCTMVYKMMVEGQRHNIPVAARLPKSMLPEHVTK